MVDIDRLNAPWMYWEAGGGGGLNSKVSVKTHSDSADQGNRGR